MQRTSKNLVCLLLTLLCRALAVSILQDVMSLLQCGAAAVVLALTDLRRLVQAAAHAEDDRSLTGTTGQISAPRKKHIKRSLLAAAQKLWFFMCWANDLGKQGTGSFPSEGGDAVFEQFLAGCVAAEWERHVASVSSNGHALEPQAMASQLKQLNISS
jgi:hypothetical protein